MARLSFFSFSAPHRKTLEFAKKKSLTTTIEEIDNHLGKLLKCEKVAKMVGIKKDKDDRLGAIISRR